MQYNLEALNLFKKLTPPRLKKALWHELLDVLSVPFDTINSIFTGFVAKIQLELKYNGQVICLEEILNLTFPGLQPIFITDNIDEIPIHYIYLTSEGSQDITYVFPQSYMLGITIPAYIYTEFEYSSIDDFFVYVPTDTFNQLQAAGELPRLKSIINKRKIAGKKYSIIVY